MQVNRLHSKLFEAVAWDLDRQIRARFVGDQVRPDYLKDFESPLAAVSHAIDAGVGHSGRFLRIKNALKRVLRPYLYHQCHVDRMIVDRLAALHSEISRLAGELAECRNELHVDLERQGESLRAEFERDSRRVGPAMSLESTPMSVTAGRATRPVTRGAKLLLGRAPVRRHGFIHIDPTSSTDADVSAPLDDLPVETATAAELVVANILELYSAAEVRERLLPYWATLLQPGGRLTVIADDAGAAADRFRDGQVDFNELTDFLFGSGELVRRSAYTPELLREYVAEAGFSDVTVTDRRQRADLGAYGFELAASRHVA